MDDNVDDDSSMDIEVKKSLMTKNKLAVIVKGKNGTPQYCCVFCPYKCIVKKTLEKHLLVHNKQYRYLCGICGTGLKRKEHLDRHTQEHMEYRPHVCPECGKGFKRKEHLNIHFATHTGQKSQECAVCNKSFYRKDHLQKHMQVHYRAVADNKSVNDKMVDIKQENVEPEHEGDMEMEGDYIQIANMNIDDFHAMFAKNYVKIGTGERPFICLLCNKTYKRKDHLKLHSMTHMKKGKTCSTCGKAFHTEEQLLAHMSMHLNHFGEDTEEVQEISRVNMLTELPESFSGDNDLLVPRAEYIQDMLVQRAEYSDADRKHVCSVCLKRFKRKQHLKIHQNVHLKDVETGGPLWCSLCNEQLSCGADILSHVCGSAEYATEEDITPSPELIKKENQLPHEFVSVDMLPDDSSQIMMFKDESDLPVPRRVYVCKFCSKTFRRKDHYKIHLNIHTGIKSFFCPDCGKGFYRKDHLQKHSQVHAKAKLATPAKTKAIPDLYPIRSINKKQEIKPEITIHAPSNTKLRMPLQIKVPYQMVLSNEHGEKHAVTIDPANLT